MVEFDAFTLDPGTRRLLRDGAEVHLSPKAFDLLVLLVEHRDKALSKATLNTALWPSTYVLESNLAGLVTEIRHALADPAATPKYIRTVHRFGYRFIGDARTSPRPPESRRPVCWLVWDRMQAPLGQGENILGRAPDATVWIDAVGVSRRHARITLDGSTATLEDLGSKNGTSVGGTQLTGPHTLADGDQIRLGSVLVTFRIPPSADSTEVLV